MPLSPDVKRHWAPAPQVVEYVAGSIPPAARVLEIGPGQIPFPRAQFFVDFDKDKAAEIAKSNTVVWCDLNSERLPFAAKSFDFVYARHVIEDMWNPLNAIAEMQRVANAGYIETPSPVAELCRGVDGGVNPPWRGYHHHRFICWEHMGELRLVSKYPLVEYLRFEEMQLAQALIGSPKNWNTYYLWNGRINVKHRQSPLDYDIPRDYQPMLAEAVQQSLGSASAFWAGLRQEPVTVTGLERAFA